MPDRNYSLRATEWLNFQSLVFNHIETYCIPQYGDKGEDPCTNYTDIEFAKQIEKYIKRYGKNSREGQQQLDLLKIAHYAGMLYTKLAEDNGKQSSSSPEVVLHHLV